MKQLWMIVIFLASLQAGEMQLYGTVGILSHHFDTDEEGNDFNEKHHAYGVEALFDQRYALSYLHFTNSRNKTTDIAAVGYRYDLYGSFGLYGVIGYQNGYCFEGLKSVECRAGKDNDGVTVLPLLYYRDKYFILDLIAQKDMVALKLNLKLYPY